MRFYRAVYIYPGLNSPTIVWKWTPSITALALLMSRLTFAFNFLVGSSLIFWNLLVSERMSFSLVKYSSLSIITKIGASSALLIIILSFSLSCFAASLNSFVRSLLWEVPLNLLPSPTNSPFRSPLIVTLSSFSSWRKSWHRSSSSVFLSMPFLFDVTIQS